jgi:hypothetical protein
LQVELREFRELVERLQRGVPTEYQAGVVEVEVSPKTVPHPVRSDVYTMGECIPLDWSGSRTDLKSRVVLYHGSFQALARLGDFDWRAEAWETLTHELRHHLEWQADLAGLEAYDWAAEQNFARIDGDDFDPVFYRNGEELAPGVFKVEDDIFIEGEQGARSRNDIDVTWHGRSYRVAAPAADRRAWVFLTLEGLADPPPGDAVLVLPGRASLLDLFLSVLPPVSATAQVGLSDA